MNQPDFATWERGNLVNFAIEAYGKLQRQEDQLQQLSVDLKVALKAYRNLHVAYNQDTGSTIGSEVDKWVSKSRDPGAFGSNVIR